jgi:hypothetical protein
MLVQRSKTTVIGHNGPKEHTGSVGGNLGLHQYAVLPRQSAPQFVSKEQGALFG